MASLKAEDIVAYTDGKKTFCPDCIESMSGMKPILLDQVSEDEVLLCDICNNII